MTLETHEQRARLIIGSYTDSLPHVVAKGKGISVLEVDGATGRIEPVTTFSELRNPTYLSLSNDGRVLYAVEELAEKDGADAATLSFDAASAKLAVAGKVPVYGDWPCHISTDRDGKRLFVSNYLSGNFVTYALDADGRPEGQGISIQRSGTGSNPDRQEGPHVHQATATLDNRHVLVCDAGTDEIAAYPLTEALIGMKPDFVANSKGGALPRHLVISNDGKRVFVIHELGCLVTSYALGADGLELLAEASTLPEDFRGESACAAIRLHPNGRFLYASNRGHDSIAAFEIGEADGSLTRIGWYGTRGQTPRDFAVAPSGGFLVVANQDSDSLAVFLLDQQTGALKAVGDTYEIGSPVCVLFAKS